MVPTILLGCGRESQAEVRGEFPLPGDATRVELVVPVGTITVVAGEPGRVRFDGVRRTVAEDPEALERIDASEFELRVTDADAGVFRLVGSGLPDGVDPLRNSRAIKLVVEVPPAIEVAIETGRGHLGVKAREADVRLVSGEGAVQIDGLRGRAHVRTAAGDVLVSGLRGEIDAETGRGTIQAFLAELGSGGARLVSAEGSIQAHVAPGDFEFRVETEVGELKTGFDVPVEQTSKYGFVASGTVGTGGPKVFVRAEKGNASLSRAASTTR